MRWDGHEYWATLYDDYNRLARLYHEDYYPRWTARLVDNSDNGKDTRITLDEAKMVLQTLAGAQL